jgi:hypothetical protein
MSEEVRSGLLLGVEPLDEYSVSQVAGAKMDDDDGDDGDDGGDGDQA